MKPVQLRKRKLPPPCKQDVDNNVMKNGKLTYEAAVDALKYEGLRDATQYAFWYLLNKPRSLPRYPKRTYKDRWTGWEDFLSTVPKQIHSPPSRPFLEARAYAMQSGIQSRVEWERLYDEGKLPPDVPRHPESRYKKYWVSWAHFFGRRAVLGDIDHTIKTNNAIDSVAVLVVSQLISAPANVVRVYVEPMGPTQAKQNAITSRETIVRMFKYDERDASKLNTILNKTSPYYGDAELRVTPNLHQLVWELTCEFELIR